MAEPGSRGTESNTESPKGNIDTLKTCIEGASKRAIDQYSVCNNLETHQEKKDCIDAANAKLMKDEGACQRAFREG